MSICVAYGVWLTAIIRVAGQRQLASTKNRADTGVGDTLKLINLSSFLRCLKVCLSFVCWEKRGRLKIVREARDASPLNGQLYT